MGLSGVAYDVMYIYIQGSLGWVSIHFGPINPPNPSSWTREHIFLLRELAHCGIHIGNKRVNNSDHSVVITPRDDFFSCWSQQGHKYVQTVRCKRVEAYW